jgi:hypothetical protein
MKNFEANFEATSKQVEVAKELMEKHGKDKIFLNDRGHFFFSLTNAAISVQSDPKRLLVIEAKKDDQAEEKEVFDTADAGLSEATIKVIDEAKQKVAEKAKAKKEATPKEEAPSSEAQAEQSAPAPDQEASTPAVTDVEPTKAAE